MNYVLDACAVVAYFQGEPGHEEVVRLLRDPTAACFIHAVNLIEVRYDGIRIKGEAIIDAAIDELSFGGVIVRRDLDDEFCRGVSWLKGVVKKVSLADCFAIQLAHQLDAEVLTSDHKEFDPLVAGGIVRARFIR